MTPFKAMISLWLVVLGAVVVGWDDAIADQNGGLVQYGFFALVAGCMLAILIALSRIGHRSADSDL